MPRVLLMEDEAFVRDAVNIALSQTGLELVSVGDGKDGLAAFEAGEFDLAIIDIYMPKLDGVKVIRQLRARKPDLPIIAISGVALGGFGRTTLDFLPSAGLKDVFCLKKPFKSRELIAAVINLLEFQNWRTH